MEGTQGKDERRHKTRRDDSPSQTLVWAVKSEKDRKQSDKVETYALESANRDQFILKELFTGKSAL